MRLHWFAAAVVVCANVCFSQIPNPGFENWATDGDGNNNPVGWQTSNSSPTVSVEPVSPAHGGSFAMKVKTMDLTIFTVPGIAFVEAGYAFTQVPSTFSAWVKSTLMPGDTAFIIVALMKGDTVIAATGDCTFKIDSSYTQYTYLEFPIAVVSSTIPDSLYVMVATSITGTSQVGTEIIVDDIAFAYGPTSVPEESSQPGTFALSQNYPNPFNGIANFELRIAERANVELRVYDLLGREVAMVLHEEKSPGIYTVQWDSGNLPSGVYYARMIAGGIAETRRIALVK